MQLIEIKPEPIWEAVRDPVESHQEKAEKALPEIKPEIKQNRAFWFAEVPNVYTADTKACAFASKRQRLFAGRRTRAQATSRPIPHYGMAVHQAAALRDEMNRQLRDLTEKNNQLQQLNHVCASYIADVAHELRNSLLTLNFYVELLAKGRNDKQEYYQRMALQSIEQLRQFVEDTLSLSRLEFSGTQRGDLLPVDLGKLIREIVQLYSAQAEAAGLSLQFESTGALPPVSGDPTLLTQVIVNLVTNAIKYTNTGWIQVKTRLLSMTNEIIIDVTDSGIGITESDLPYIFERFYRAQDEQIHAIPGTGLGLAIVKEIVTMHRGEITVDSAPGLGSRFRVRLPVA